MYKLVSHAFASDMAGVAVPTIQPVDGRLILSRPVEEAQIGTWKAKYPESPLGGTFSSEHAEITSVDDDSITVDFGPSEDFEQLIEYPLDYAIEMLTTKCWIQPGPNGFPIWSVAILMNRLRYTNTLDFYKAPPAPDRNLSEWRLETLHLSSAAWVCAREWLAREADQAGRPEQVVRLYGEQTLIMEAKEPGDSGEDVGFDNSASDVVEKHVFPLTLPSGHLNGVRSLPSCIHKTTRAWKIYRLSTQDGGPILEECLGEWPSDTAVRNWTVIPGKDHVTMAEGRYTSAFSEMGMRAHRRLMAKADVARENDKDLSQLVLSHEDVVLRETKFNEWLANNFDDGDPRKVPTWKELAYFVAGVAGGLDAAGFPMTAYVNNTAVATLAEPTDPVEIRLIKGAVRNYAPCRETPIMHDVHWPHSDCWIVHNFAYNAWVAVCAWAAVCTEEMKVLEAEVAVIWPFGLHTGKADVFGSRAACGKPFETRVDLVCEFVPILAPDGAPKQVVIIEFKTKMERKNPYENENDPVYRMNKSTDCRQPVLNAWLYYFQTLRLPGKCLLVYTTRRGTRPQTNKECGLDNAIVGEIDFAEIVKQNGAWS